MLEDNQYGMPYGEMQEILRKARKTYGNKNQILVCIEELNELACVLAKYPRYTDEEQAKKELYSKALDEVADVYTVLEHIKAIFDISEEALWQRRGVKVGRVQRWLSHSTSMNETITDRDVEPAGENAPMCSGCIHVVDFTEATYRDKCVHCLKAQATEGTAPFKKTITTE